MTIKNPVFKSLKQPCQALAVDRAGRPDPELVDQTGRPTCTRMCTLTCHLGRSTARSTDCKYPTLGWGRSTGRSTVRLGTVDRAVDRPESNCSLAGRPLGRPCQASRSTVPTREWGTFSRSTGLSGWSACTFLCTSVDRSGRSTLGPVDRLGRSPEPGRAV